MDISKQVCTIEQGKQLKSLGINSISQWFSWVTYSPDPIGEGGPYHSVVYDQENSDEARFGEFIAPAFTIAELGQMLNSETYTMRTGTELSAYANWEWIDQGNGDDNGGFDTEAEARAAMLIEMLKSKLISAEDANKRLNA